MRQRLNDITCREVEAEKAVLRARYEMLTRREREVMGLVVSGLLNKQIASDLGTREITVKVHRAQVMLGFESPAPGGRPKSAKDLEVFPRLCDEP